MGCAGSKLDDLPVVALCRERTQFLGDAIEHRYLLADSHARYAHSLRSVALLLLHFVSDKPSPKPKGNPKPSFSLSLSRSGSHLHFSDSVSDSPLHTDTSSPVHHHLHPVPDDPPARKPRATHVHHSLAVPPAPSVSHEHADSGSLRRINVHDPSPSSSCDGTNFYSYIYPVVPSPPPESRQPPPPPPPPPPQDLVWDFLDLFDESYYQVYPSSRSSKEVREEEGIPELEEEEEQEVVKEAYCDSMSVTSTSLNSAGTSSRKSLAASKDGRISTSFEEDLRYKSGKPGEGRGNDDVEGNDDVDVVEKNVVADEVRKGRLSEVRIAEVPRDAYGVATEIKLQFERASYTACKLAKMLEVGKMPYHQKHTVCHASRIICMMPSLASKDHFLDPEEDKSMSTGNLSSTLQKLYIWETKLYDEVKAEEKMRMFREKQCNRLKNLDESGAEAQKVDSTQAMIRKLAAKIRISMQIVDSISQKINRLRDEELWPQITELIQGFNGMWKVMMECHHVQRLAFSEAKSVDFVPASRKFSDNHMEVVVQLELELLEWIGNFYSWIIAQKSYVKALNDWLLRCLHYDPEETSDGIAPFSPGRIGAPPVFVICNYWSQAMERISEGEVLNAMHAFASNVRRIWEQHDVTQGQSMMANKDMDGKLKTRDRDAQMINKAMDALNKKLVLVSGQCEIPVAPKQHDVEPNDVHLGMEHLFEAMENFTATCVKAYEELLARAVEEVMTTRGEIKGL